MFDTGDAIVHPTRGVGVVVDIEERQWQGNSSQYYQIELLGREPNVKLMIPIQEADELGIRLAIRQPEVEQVWCVIRAEPANLPENHKTRHKVLKEKLHAGDIFLVAEVLRDLTWRQREEERLTTRGKRLYKEALGFLAAEIAAAQQVEVSEANSQIMEKLGEILSL